MSVDVKRKETEANSDDEDIGPQPSEMVAKKPRKEIKFEHLFIDNLPSIESYERSYMHRDVITHILVTPRTDFIISASCDGHIKFWKKMAGSIEFVKHFRAHLGNVQDISCNSTGSLVATISSDGSVKIFDVINFDMINMMELSFKPQSCQWVHSSGDPISAIAISESDSGTIRIFDGKGTSEPIHELTDLHVHPVVLIRYNDRFATAVSVDRKGMIEYWSSAKRDYKFPEDVVEFDSQLDTHLYEFVKSKTMVHDISFSPDGTNFATISADRKIRIFKFRTGQLLRVFDESLEHIASLQKMKQICSGPEFGRRMAIENELEKSDSFVLQRILFDSSGNFVLYPTLCGVKVVNWITNKCIKMLGKTENLRVLGIALYQDIPNKPKAAISAEMEAAENPNLEKSVIDPSLFVTSYKKNRFYIFSKRDPEQLTGDRDIFNEKPSREDILAATDEPIQERLAEYCTIHTSMGDIHCKLFLKETPKTVENFCVHAKNGYYNNHIFHRVIKQFMIQTGDPTGTGTGGESIWGGEFADEFHPSLKHDKPFMMSMANAGPNTNGSQFFITVIPCNWLDNKHTIFGQVVSGMEVVQNISNVRTNRKTDKPFDEVKIVSITLK